jgi:hypothetical protein
VIATLGDEVQITVTVTALETRWHPRDRTPAAVQTSVTDEHRKAPLLAKNARNGAPHVKFHEEAGRPPVRRIFLNVCPARVIVTDDANTLSSPPIP